MIGFHWCSFRVKCDNVEHNDIKMCLKLLCWWKCSIYWTFYNSHIDFKVTLWSNGSFKNCVELHQSSCLFSRNVWTFTNGITFSRYAGKLTTHRRLSIETTVLHLSTWIVSKGSWISWLVISHGLGLRAKQALLQKRKWCNLKTNVQDFFMPFPVWSFKLGLQLNELHFAILSLSISTAPSPEKATIRDWFCGTIWTYFDTSKEHIHLPLLCFWHMLLRVAIPTSTNPGKKNHSFPVVILRRLL